MNNHLISLASGVVPELGPAETVIAASAGGWDAVGLWVEPEKWLASTSRDVRHRLDETGLKVLDVEVVWIKPGALDPMHLRTIDIGAEIGAANVLVVSSDPDNSATCDKFAALCAHGRKAGLRIALEFGYFSDIHSLRAALEIVKAANNPAGALLIDPLHLTRTGGAVTDVAAITADLLPYAQFCDAPARGPGGDDLPGSFSEAVDGRLQCGEGELPLDELLSALPSGIPLSIEIRSKHLRDQYPDTHQRSRVTAEVTRGFLNRTR